MVTSFHITIPTRMPVAAMPGAASGRYTRSSDCSSVQPSTRAASPRSRGTSLKKAWMSHDREGHREDLVDERQSDLRVEEADLLVEHVHRDDEQEFGQGIGQQQPQGQPASGADPEADDGVGRRRRDDQGEDDADAHHDDAVEEGSREVALLPDLGVLAEVGDVDEVRWRLEGVDRLLGRDDEEPVEREQRQPDGDDGDAPGGRTAPVAVRVLRPQSRVMRSSGLGARSRPGAPDDHDEGQHDDREDDHRRHRQAHRLAA